MIGKTANTFSSLCRTVDSSLKRRGHRRESPIWALSAFNDGTHDVYNENKTANDQMFTVKDNYEFKPLYHCQENQENFQNLCLTEFVSLLCSYPKNLSIRTRVWKVSVNQVL
jgi:hypothetical protein